MNTTHGSLSSYIVGFVLSIGLTLLAFWVAPLLGAFVYPAIVITALIQLLVQVMFFLDLGNEPRPQWHLLVFVFTGIIIGIVVGGTLWIMSNLDHMHMHSPTTSDIYEGGVVAPQNELH